MILQLIKAIVKFTPTEKDDEAIAHIESFLEQHPELALTVLKLLMSLLKSKSE
jgi:hypothetical protein